MKIIVFSYDFPPNTGGISRLTENIAINLAKDKNVELEVLTLNNDKRKPIDKEIKINTVSATLNGRIFEAYRYLVSLNDKDNTIIICGLWWPEGFVAEMAGFKNVYILTHAAELRPDKTFFRKFFWIPMFSRYVLSHAKGVVANSEFTADLSKHLSLRNNVYCNPLAVDHTLFIPKINSRRIDETFEILTVTRIHLWKGLDTILDALCLLPEESRRKIRWKIAGKGPDLDKFKTLVSDSVLAGQVELLGFVPDEKLPDLYASADVFALCTRADEHSSNIEGFGLVFLESQSSGTPVIGTPFGGIPSAVENGNGGWLISDAKHLSFLLCSLIENHEELKNQGVKARRRVESEFTWEKYIERLKSFIKIE